MNSNIINIDNSFAVIGDVHGMYDQLSMIYDYLLEHYPDIISNGFLFHLGDLVDRGMDSKKVLDLIISRNIKGVQGNHDEIFAAIQNPSVMKMHLTGMMGGFNTFASYMPNKVPLESLKDFLDYKKKIETRTLLIPDSELREYIAITTAHRNYCDQLPPYRIIYNKQQYYLLSHAGCNLKNTQIIGNTIVDETLNDSQLALEEMLWTHKHTLPICKLKQITGHLPDDDVRHDGNNWWLDTGGCWPGGKLSCLIMPEKIIIQSNGNNINIEKYE